MDIEEIKRRLEAAGTQPEPDIKPPGAPEGWTINDPYTSSARAIPDALLWIIERLEQEMPTVKVARLEPGDVVVVTVPFTITQDVRSHMTRKTEERFPGHAVLVLDAGITLSAVGRQVVDEEPCCSLPDDIPHEHAAFADVVDAFEVKRE